MAEVQDVKDEREEIYEHVCVDKPSSRKCVSNIVVGR